MIKKFLLFFVLALISLKGYMQSEIILRDTVYTYSYNTPSDSIIYGTTILENDSADQVINEFDYELGEESGELILSNWVKKEYDIYGNILSEIVSYMNPETEYWVMRTKILKKYDEYAHVTQISQYGYTNGEIDGFSTRQNDFEYDLNGNLTRDTEYSWNGSWVKKSMTQDTFNEQGKLALRQTFGWSDLWKNLNEYHYSYDTEGKLLLIQAYAWNSPLWNWELAWNNSFFYDALDRLQIRIDSSSNNKYSVWDISSEEEYSYVENGDTVISISRKWNLDSQTWLILGKIEKIIDTFGRVTFSADYRWDDLLLAWNGNLRKVEMFNDRGELCYQQISSWDEISNEWRKQSDFYKIQNEFGVTIDYIARLWNSEINDFQILIRDFYKRDKYNYVTTNSICKGEILEWNGHIFDSTGFFTDSYISKNGRDSLQSLSLKVIEVPVWPEMEITGGPVVTELLKSAYIGTEIMDVTYSWTIENGSILSYPDNNSVLVLWGTRGLGTVSCIAEHISGCKRDSSELEVLLEPNGIKNSHEELFSVFPNPVSSSLHIKTTTKNNTIFIVDQNGKVLMKSTKEDINVEFIPAGSYYVIIQGNNGEILHKQLIIHL